MGYVRVKKGMVFWYTVDPKKDKTIGDFFIEGTSYKDYTEYGMRPWVVVSGDEYNCKNTNCTIAPMTTSMRPIINPNEYEVCFKFLGKRSAVMINQIRFVNTVELRDYMACITDEDIERVDQALAGYLGINISQSKVIELPPASSGNNYEEEPACVETIEDAKIVKDKQNEIAAKKDDTTTTDEKEKTIIDFRPSVEHESQVSKFYKRYPALKKKVEPVKKVEVPKSDSKVVHRPHMKWTRQRAMEFVEEVRSTGAAKLCNKYQINMKQLYAMKYYAQKLLKKFEVIV